MIPQRNISMISNTLVNGFSKLSELSEIMIIR